MEKILADLGKLPRWRLLTICLLVCAAVGITDYTVGEASLSILYVLPIFIASWLIGKDFGYAVALVCAVELFVINILTARNSINILSIKTWNSFMAASFLVLIAHVLSLLKRELLEKKQHADALEAANLELDAFNYTVAHDLRKPLTTIVGYSELVLESGGDNLNEKMREYVEGIRDGAMHMNDLINALLNFSSSAHCKLQFARIDLSVIARRIVAELQLSEPERRVNVQIADGITAWGDSALLETVLENLIGNAWKYTCNNPQAAISFDLVSGSRERVYSVQDNGIGFDCSQSDRIFTPFQRLTGSEGFSGFGIGLATVKRIIERHNGRIWAESAKGHGSSFHFTLPEEVDSIPSK